MPDISQPTLILLAGMPGTGKSTLGVALSRALGIPVLDKDTLKHTLLAASIPEEVAAGVAYELLFALAKDLVVTQGGSVILDSPALYPRILARAEEVAGAAGVPLRVIACRVEFAVRQRRMAQRKRLLSHLSGDSTSDRAAAARLAHLPPGTLWLDTSEPVEALLEKAIPYILAP